MVSKSFRRDSRDAKTLGCKSGLLTVRGFRQRRRNSEFFCYSSRRARIGSTSDARRAGAKVAATVIASSGIAMAGNNA